MAAGAGAARRLEQEPGSLLGLIEKSFEKARRRDVFVVVADLMRVAHGLGHRLIVFQQFGKHAVRRNEFLVIVLDAR